MTPTRPHKAINTTDLTKRIQAGSRRAEDEFAAEFTRTTRLFLLKKTRNPDIAKDCCQQTLLITLVKIRAGDVIKPESLLSFVKNTASNVATAYFRKEQRYSSLNDEVLSTLTGHNNVAERDMDSETIRKKLNGFLSLLTVKRDREILYRFYLRDEGKSMIRHDLNISTEHFDRVLCRAKSRLRRLLSSHTNVQSVFRQSLGNPVQTGRNRRGARRLLSTRVARMPHVN